MAINAFTPSRPCKWMPSRACTSFESRVPSSKTRLTLLRMRDLLIHRRMQLMNAMRAYLAKH